jgi:hypothetical protein
MSELKAFDITVAEEGYCEGVVKYRRAVYDKSEADKYIKELKEQNHELCQALHSMYSEEEMNYQKYKRCLAMAEMCNARYDEEDAKVNGCGASWEYISKKMKYWERWQWRWEALAEKFKEAK